MKKLLAFVLAIIMMLSFAGCGSIKKSDIVGHWESPNRVEYSASGDRITWDNYALTFYEDGSVTYAFDFLGKYDYTPCTYKIKGDSVLVYNILNVCLVKLKYDDSDSVPKLMGSQADGYWYEKVSE